MGVKDLWSILSPICDKKSLWELRGKTIAIDLSAWVCDSQFAPNSQLNLYLRNLFFRTSYLLQIGVKPIFVLEGSPPEIKLNTIYKRLNRNVDPSTKNSFKRSRLSALQKQCVDFLSSLGIACIKAPGEAEAFCAHLNQLGFVSGVVTQDSDVFLYGATEVYRNFNLSPSYSCDVYRMDSIERQLSLTRSRMIALALLLGSDYCDGVSKIGKETALKYIKTIPESTIFERFQSWRKESLFAKAEKDKYCPGSSIELTIREKALEDENFPNMKVVDEYMTLPADINLEFKWSVPDINKFISFAARKLCWEESYAEKKIVPMVTRWHLVNMGAECGLQMKKIIKKRNLKGVKGYEVQWDKYEDITTIEERDLVYSVYPELVDAYEGTGKRNLPKKSRKRRKSVDKKRDDEDFNSKYLKETNMDVLGCSTRLTDINASFTEELNLSDIVSTIVSRANSNPALRRIPLHSMTTGH